MWGVMGVERPCKVSGKTWLLTNFESWICKHKRRLVQQMKLVLRFEVSFIDKKISFNLKRKKKKFIATGEN